MKHPFPDPPPIDVSLQVFGELLREFHELFEDLLEIEEETDDA